MFITDVCVLPLAKMKDYMDRWVTSPKQVTSPTWGSSRQRQLESYKSNRLNRQNNNSARSAHFFNLSLPSLHHFELKMPIVSRLWRP